MAELKSRLYKLALWYIRKCNAEWNKRSFKNELEALDRLTYLNFGKYMLTYGADAEWQIFSRYEVLDNAIQKLAKYENATTTESEIRASVIDEFAEKLKAQAENLETAIEVFGGSYGQVICETVDEIAEWLKGE